VGRKLGRMFSALLVVLLFVTLAAAAGTYWYLRSYQRTWTLDPLPEEMAFLVDATPARVAVDSNVELHGWMIRQDGIAPGIWIIPDLGENQNIWWPLLIVLAKEGYHVLFVNYRGHAPSKGTFSPDVQVLEHDRLTVQTQMPHWLPRARPLALFAHGFGAFWALKAACDLDEIRLLVLEDPVAQPIDRMLLELEIPFAMTASPWYDWWTASYRWLYGDPKMASTFACLERKKHLQISYVFIVSHQANPVFTATLYQQLPEPKEQIRVPRTLNMGLSQEELEHYLSTVRQTLQRYLPRDVDSIAITQRH